MSKQKSYNSIFFLTTLSVYLGLVLVGASPSVLAQQQAVFTGKFEVEKEIESNDDLDKNPDDEVKNLVNSVETYFEELKEFISDLQKLHSIEKFDLDYDKFQVEVKSFVPCNVDGCPIRKSYENERIDNYWLVPALIDAKNRFENWDFLSDCLPTDKFTTGVATNVNFKLSYDKSELKLEISANKESTQKAALLAEKLNKAKRLYEIDEDEVIVKKLYQNTIFKAENDQVFVITILPRGSLDALIESKRK